MNYHFKHPKQKRVLGIRTSDIEIDHLLKAWLAISFAFAILLGGGVGALFSYSIVIGFFISAVTVGIGFIFHELAHKLTAQKYGCFAEFRANFRMLLFAIVLSFFGFIIAAPGAVVILGHPGEVRYGRISAAGPAANFILAILFAPLLFIANPIVNLIGIYGFTINAFLGLFNLIPFGFFDGAKIFKWNKVVYGIMVAIGFILLFARSVIAKLIGGV